MLFSNNTACGEEGIRTPDTFADIHAFQACALSHSATSPIEENQAPLQRIKFAFTLRKRATKLQKNQL